MERAGSLAQILASGVSGSTAVRAFVRHRGNRTLPES